MTSLFTTAMPLRLSGEVETSTRRRRPVTTAAGAAVHRLLAGINGGQLLLREDGCEHSYGSAGVDADGRETLSSIVEVHDPRFYTAVLREGTSGLGDAYRLGWFDTDDLTTLLRLLARSLQRFDPARRRLHQATDPIIKRVASLRRPDPTRDRRNIVAHYDLSNAFFELFLDETLTYSSGWFDSPGSSLAEASRAKIDRICRKLELKPGQRIVEIGTGWGAFAMHAASVYGVDVVTTTLSKEQYNAATKRIADAGLADQIEVRLDHFRDLHGTFDAVVAVEMIEAVDWRELDDFMEQCARLVHPDGAIALQAIVTAPARQQIARSSNDFIKSRVFPGSSIPSVGSILEAATRATDLLPTDLTDFGLHYAETLRRWRANLADNRDQAYGLGLDEAFLRLWDFYLSYCEAGFEERLVSVVQLVLEHPGRAPSL